MPFETRVPTKLRGSLNLPKKVPFYRDKNLFAYTLMGAHKCWICMCTLYFRQYVLECNTEIAVMLNATFGMIISLFKNVNAPLKS